MGDASGWSGDAAYERLLAEHGEALARFAFLLTGNRFDAEDAVQDAVIAVAAHWRRIPKEQPYGYLRKAVARKAIDIARRHRGVVDPEDQPMIEFGYLRLESDIEFLRMVRELPEKQRAVLALRYHEQLDDAEIGRVLGCTQATVRSQASRALAKLRQRLAVDAAPPAMPMPEEVPDGA